MKPKDLKYPFKFEDRRPFMGEGIFFVPDHYDSYDEWQGEFLQNPVSVEYCSGNGEWIVGMAEKFPDMQWIAVEMDFERVRKIYAKKVNRGLDNLLIVSGKAQNFTKHYLPDQSVDAIYVNFPDPWPKDRHAKHRLIQGEFVDELKRISRGSITFVTDDLPYHVQMREQMHRRFPKFSTDPIPEYGTSFFERLWVGKGREIHFLRY